MRTPLHTPLERALCSLEGLSVSDAFGERFFVHPQTVEHLIAARAARPTWRFTDDTQWFLAPVAVLINIWTCMWEEGRMGTGAVCPDSDRWDQERRPLDHGTCSDGL
jgi:hypothetical protein